LSVAVIGIGNLLRADDGVGAHVVRRLNEGWPDIYAVDLSTAEIGVLDHVRGKRVVVIIDAILSGARPGSIHRVELGDVADEAFTRSHGLSLASSLQLGYRLYPGEMPEKIVVLAVEAGDIESFSTDLTPEVEAAVPEIINEVLREVEAVGPPSDGLKKSGLEVQSAF
jgi:hydrogenase maturation protease